MVWVILFTPFFTYAETPTDNPGEPCIITLPHRTISVQRKHLINLETGNSILEDCTQARTRTINKIMSGEGGSAEKNDKESMSQKLGSIITYGGAGTAASIAAACAANEQYSCATTFGMGALTLLGSARNLENASGESKQAADDWAGGVYKTGSDGPNTNNPGPNDPNNPNNPPNDPNCVGPHCHAQTPPTPPPGQPGGLPTVYEPPPVQFTDPNGKIISMIPTEQGVRDYLKDLGIKVSDDGNSITLPDGSTYSANEAKALDTSTMPPDKLQAFNEQMDQIKAQVESGFKNNNPHTANTDKKEDENAKDKAKDGKGGGGFKGYASGRKGAGGERKPSSSLEQMLKNAKKQNSVSPSSVSGMSVRYGRDRIGVSQDNIFEMIHRRYQIKRKSNFFRENKM